MLLLDEKRIHVWSKEEMKQLANAYEAGNWSPFGEIGGNFGEDRPDESDTRDKGPHAITP